MRSTTAVRTRLIKSFSSIIIAVSLLGLLGSTISPRSAQAIDKLSYSISPLLFELTANPGDLLTNNLKITNLSSGSINIKMEVEAFTGTETGQAKVTETGDPAYSLNDWVIFSPGNFALEAGKTQVVQYTIHIPQNAEPGGRYGSLLATTTSTSLDGTGVATVNKIGSLILLKVSGRINYSASIQSFKSSKTLYERTPIDFEARVFNESTVHIKPRGFLTIANNFGHKVADLPIDERNILPSEGRLYPIKWSSNYHFGKFTATLFLIYGENNAQITATTTFILFPWKIGLPILALIIFLIILVVRKRHNIGRAFSVLAGKE